MNASRKVRIRKVTLRFKKAATTSRGAYLHRHLWYLEAEVYEGNRKLWGIGECAPLPDLSCDDRHRYLTVMSEAAAYFEQSGQIPKELLRDFPSLLMGFESLAYSLAGARRWDNPYHLFDTPFSKGEAGQTINGLVWMGDFDTMNAAMEQKVEQGFRCVKLKIGAINFMQELELLRRLRQRYPAHQLEIRLDANGAFHPEEALEKLHKLAKFDIHSLEQPIRTGQWKAMAQLCQHSPIPIALDEELIGINNLQQKVALLDLIRPQYIILKPTLHGGFSGAEEWMKLADERNIAYWATSALESNVGLNAIAQWCAAKMPADRPLAQGLGTGQLFVENYPQIHLHIEGEQLWSRTSAQRNYAAAVAKFQAEWQEDTPTMEAHTSGSTGQPQAFQLQKTRMKQSAERTIDHFGLNAESHLLLCLPLDFIAGKMQLLRQMLCGGKLSIVAPSTRPLRHLCEAPSFAAMTPLQVMHTLDHEPDRSLFAQIDTVLIGGGPISATLSKKLQSLAPKCYSSYGMTETYSHIALRRLNGKEAQHSYHALPDITLSQDETGCLVISSPTLSDHPLHTTDLVQFETDGSFHILGRRDNVICSGGLKHQVEQLETRLSTLPCRCALTALPHDALGEALTLIYEANEDAGKHITPEELRTYCQAALSKHEQPLYYLPITTLPLTPTGKIARAELKTWAQQTWQSNSSKGTLFAKNRMV